MKDPEEHSAHLLWGAEVRPVVLGQEDHLEDFQRGLTAVGAVAVLHEAAFQQEAAAEAVAEIVIANKKEDHWVLFFVPPMIPSGDTYLFRSKMDAITEISRIPPTTLKAIPIGILWRSARSILIPTKTRTAESP